MKQSAAVRQVSQSPDFTYFLHYPNVFALVTSQNLTTDGTEKNRLWVDEMPLESWGNVKAHRLNV